MALPISIQTQTPQGSKTITEFSHGPISFGRGTDNTVVINSVAVSRTHGELLEAGSQWVYRDNKSSNGSWLNGKLVEPGNLALIRLNDNLTIADSSLLIGESNISPNGKLPDGNASLLVFLRDQFKFEFSFSSMKKPFTLGGPEASLLLDGAPPNKVQFTVTRMTTGSLILNTKDLNTGLYIDGKEVRKTAQLDDRSLLEIGAYKMVASLS